MIITLARQSMESVRLTNRFVWPLRVTASSEDGDPAIFVYHRRARFDLDDEDRFECIASVNQMLEIPVDEPDMTPDPETGEVIPYYRKAALEFNCRSAEEADDLWQRIREDVKDLVNNMLAWELLEPAETVVIGPSPALEDLVEPPGGDPHPQYATDDDLGDLREDVENMDIDGGAP